MGRVWDGTAFRWVWPMGNRASQWAVSQTRSPVHQPVHQPVRVPGGLLGTGVTVQWNDPFGSDQAAGREQRFRWENPLFHPAVSNFSGFPFEMGAPWDPLGGCLHYR